MKLKPFTFIRDIIWLSVAVIVLFFFLGIVFGKPANATGNTPPATPTPTVTGSQGQEQKAIAGAAAGAVAGATSTSGALSGSVSGATGGNATGGNATGTGGNGLGVGIGQGGGGGTGTGGDSAATGGKSISAANGGGLTDNSRSGVYVLPPPVWTTVPAAANCIATRSVAGSFLLGVVSGSKTEQKSDPACVGIIMAKAAYDHCHFESEALIMQRVYDTVFPGYPALPIAPGTRNHTLAECEDLKRPRLTMTPAIHTPATQPVVVPQEPRPARADRQ